MKVAVVRTCILHGYDDEKLLLLLVMASWSQNYTGEQEVWVKVQSAFLVQKKEGYVNLLTHQSYMYMYQHVLHAHSTTLCNSGVTTVTK